MILPVPILVIGAALALASPPSGEGMVQVGPGIYRPLYPASDTEREVPVKAFQLNALPVSNADYLVFVQAHPRWAQDEIKGLYADERYLSLWEGPHTLGAKAQPQQPVVHVSWFAARAYCDAQGARLPTEQEWELAAMASPTQADATKEPAWLQQVLDWYARPSGHALPEIGARPANVWGVHDLHGLVWEWVEDFDANLVSSDNREGGDEDRQRFCGAGALDATQIDDYASFMRLAFRSSLKARYTTKNLGFRCAKEITP